MTLTATMAASERWFNQLRFIYVLWNRAQPPQIIHGTDEEKKKICHTGVDFDWIETYVRRRDEKPERLTNCRYFHTTHHTMTIAILCQLAKSLFLRKKKKNEHKMRRVTTLNATTWMWICIVMKHTVNYLFTLIDFSRHW